MEQREENSKEIQDFDGNQNSKPEMTVRILHLRNWGGVSGGLDSPQDVAERAYVYEFLKCHLCLCLHVNAQSGLKWVVSDKRRSPGDMKKDIKGLKDYAKHSFGRLKKASGSCF